MSLFTYTTRTLEAMIWKCWRVRKHHWIRTIVEIAAPVFLVLLLVSVNAVMEPSDLSDDTSKPTYFIAYDMKYLIRQLCRFSCTTSDEMKILAYAPNNDTAHGLVTWIMTVVEKTLMEHGVDVLIRGFESEAELEAYHAMLGLNSGYDNTMSVPKRIFIVAAVVFISHPSRQDSTSGDLVYKIRLINGKFITGKLFPDIEYPGPGRHYRLYETQGFLGLQMAVDTAFIEIVHGSNLSYTLETQAFQYPPYRHQDKTHYTTVLSRILPAAIVIGFSYMVTTTTTEIVRERETGVQKFLKMMVGLSTPGYWLSWMINFTGPALLAIVLITMLLTVNLDGTGAVLAYSSTGVIILFLLCYLFSAAWFVLFTATLFKSSAMANSLGVIMWAGSFVMPALLIGNKQKYLGSQLMASVLPNMCLYWGFHTIANWEAKVIGLRWKNVADYPSTVESINMALIMIELIFSGFFYMILTMHIQSEHRRGRPLKYPFKLLYDALYDDTKFPEFLHILHCGCGCCERCGKCKCKLCCCRQSHYKEHQNKSGMDVSAFSAIGRLRTKVLQASDMHGVELFNTIRFAPDTFEKEDVDRVAGIKLRNVSKSFKGETVLKFLSCDFYEDEITVLVGPSGAGKTTLINAITGMDEPEDGIIYVNRYDTRDYPTEVRLSTGLCPQNDMLFEELTVMEHLVLFAWLKIGAWQEAKTEAMRLVQQLDLRDQAKTRSFDLTSGQRRKLSLAIAIAGDPKVILLDEATAGLDADSQNAVWNMLQKIREERTILITTHSMDEAGVLADRVAVISDGCLKSFGTPQFLSKAYGNYYTLRFRVATPKGEKLLRILLSEIPSARVNSREIAVGGEEISFLVPQSCTSCFPTLFSQLYERRDALGVLTIDVHRTSMEEVFFGVKEFPEFNKLEVKAKAPAQREHCESQGTTDNGKMKTNNPPSLTKLKLPADLCCSRMKILLRKQLWLARANTVLVICQIILPVMLVLSGITSANRAFRTLDVDHHGGVKITLEDYSSPVTLYSIPFKEMETAFVKTAGKSAKSTRSTDLLRAVTNVGIHHERNYRRKYIVGAQLNREDGTFTALYNTVPYHSPPLGLNLVANTLLKHLEPRRKLSITVENHPLPNASEETLEALSSDAVHGVVKAFCLYFPYAIAMVSGFSAVRPLREKTSGALHLQLMTGTHPLNFWASYVIADGAYVLVLSALVLLLVWMVEESTLYTMDEGGITLFVIFFVACMAATSFSYFVVHWTQRSSGAALGWLNMFHLTSVFLSYIIYQSHPDVDDVVSIVYYSLTVLFPVPLVVHTWHTFARICIYNSRCAMVSEKVLSAICDKTGPYMYLPSYGCCQNCRQVNNGTCFKPLSYFHETGGSGSVTIFVDLVVLTCVTGLYLVLVILIDAGYGQKLERSCFAATADAFDLREGLSKNTAEEAETVRKLAGMGDDAPISTALLVDGICKNYGNIAAVANVSFATQFGECFGILGLNGAGKTTVLKILAGKTMPAVGDCYLMPSSLFQERLDYLSAISYCPQKNALLYGLTGRQHLELYGALRGLSRTRLAYECQYWLDALGLEHDGDRMCGDYSAGMQQRLRVAQALIGGPKVVILDEPTAGLDPTGKRHMWTTLQRLQRIGKAVIIASQNIQECEVLCSRVGLMVGGRMRIVDRTSEVKKMFLHGYTVVFHLKQLRIQNDSAVISDAGGVSQVGDVRQELEAVLGECIPREARPNALRYLIPQREQNWGDLFRKLEEIRLSMGDVVESYAITSSSLDEVFHAISEMDGDSSRMLSRNQVTCLQSCLLGNCCKDDFA